ncbi:MAG: NUDIX domain-containing protein [Saccharospirillaceae bacterium]|nr:NUDIX domain-containing protein [Saccharospirillaceae bacterium]MCD8533017.1 NUDIX domain-containing protein [Saccharospirillaceae bacterium]
MSVAITPQPFAPCVSFILLRDGCVLLEKRREDKEIDPGMVMVPGGHMEEGEHQHDTLIRELDEELGIQPLNARYVCSLLHPTDELQLLHYYLITDWTGEIQAHEAETVFWQPLSGLNALDIAPDHIAIAEALRLYLS